MLKSLDILDKLVKLATRDFGPSIEELEKKGISINQIKQDLEILDIFRKYISLSYIKNLISENEFSLNNFDWDIKDEKRLTNRIEELLKLKQWLESDKVGDNHD